MLKNAKNTELSYGYHMDKLWVSYGAHRQLSLKGYWFKVRMDNKRKSEARGASRIERGYLAK